jgi:hypothetical protein
MLYYWIIRYKGHTFCINQYEYINALPVLCRFDKALTFMTYLINHQCKLTRVTLPVILVEQELFTLPEFIPFFSGVRGARSSLFCVVFCTLLFVRFLSTISLSVLLRFTAFDCPLLFSNFSYIKYCF